MKKKHYVLGDSDNAITGNFVWDEDDLGIEGAQLLTTHNIYEMNLSLNSRSAQQIETGLNKLLGVESICYPNPAYPAYSVTIDMYYWTNESKLRQRLNKIFYRQPKAGAQ